MRAIGLAVLAVALASGDGCPSSTKRKEAKAVAPAASIGSATMTQDGTIILDLRAEGPGGARGDARFVYPRGHKQYQEILDHVGGLRPGESKPVPPWPEKK